MNDNHDTTQLPPIQLLVAACPMAGSYGWLHGFCLLTYTQVGDTVRVDGQLRVGNPYCDNYDLVTELADALDPAACLAAIDLHDVVSRLGRLPIGTRDQEPALAVLGKLQAMLDSEVPIDLALDDDHTTELAVKALEHAPGFSESLVDHDGVQVRAGALGDANLDNLNPQRLAQDLAEAASIAILTLGELYLPVELRPKLLAAWMDWRHRFAPSIPLPKPALTVVSSD